MMDSWESGESALCTQTNGSLETKKFVNIETILLGQCKWQQANGPIQKVFEYPSIVICWLPKFSPLNDSPLRLWCYGVPRRSIKPELIVWPFSQHHRHNEVDKFKSSIRHPRKTMLHQSFNGVLSGTRVRAANVGWELLC